MFKRSMAIVAAAAVTALVLVPPATAQEVEGFESYGAGASSSALVITLLGQQIAVSETIAAVGSEPAAVANGAALLIAGTPVPGDALAQSPEGPETNSVCPIEIDLSELSGGAIDLLAVEIACLETEASTTNGTFAQSASGEVVITVLAPGGDVLEPILTPLLGGVTDVADPILDGLEPLIGAIDEVTEINLEDLVDELLEDVQTDLFVLAQITVAPSVSQAGANSTDGVFARSGAAGVTVDLLPGIASTLAELLDLADTPAGAQEPLVSVVLGQANAQVVRDPVTGAARPDASAAQLLGIETSDSLGILQDLTGSLTEALDGLAAEPLECAGDGPLAGVVCIDLGLTRPLTDEELTARGYEFGAGTVGQLATAANIEVLGVLSDSLGGPAVGITLAGADAAANAILAGAPPVDPPVVTTQDPLPRTGAEDAAPLAVTLFAVAVAGLVLVRRTRSV